MTKLTEFLKANLPGPLLRPLIAGNKAWFAHLAMKEAKRNASHIYDVYYRPAVDLILPTAIATREIHNFTYDLTDRNLRYMAATIACATHKPVAEIDAYIDELVQNSELNAHVLGATSRLNVKSPFGRRLGWCAVARATKPRVIVETGVERGHGSVVLCAALLKNAEEGHPGRYYGTDHNPKAGGLLTGKYASVGKILYGDSIASLTALDENIDLFINDSDHSAEYEFREYGVVEKKLTPHAIILSDNAHSTDALEVYSRQTGRNFLFFREDPLNHWYPGAGIGFSFP